MKTKQIVRLITMLFCALLIASPIGAKEKKEKKEKVKVLFACDLHCQDCVDKINKNIAFEKGVTDLNPDLKAKTVEVTFRVDKTSKEKIVAAFKKIGKDVTEIDPAQKAEHKGGGCDGH